MFTKKIFNLQLIVIPDEDFDDYSDLDVCQLNFDDDGEERKYFAF